MQQQQLLVAVASPSLRSARLVPLNCSPLGSSEIPFIEGKFCHKRRNKMPMKKSSGQHQKTTKELLIEKNVTYATVQGYITSWPLAKNTVCKRQMEFTLACMQCSVAEEAVSRGEFNEWFSQNTVHVFMVIWEIVIFVWENFPQRKSGVTASSSKPREFV